MSNTDNNNASSIDFDAITPISKPKKIVNIFDQKESDNETQSETETDSVINNQKNNNINETQSDSNTYSDDEEYENDTDSDASQLLTQQTEPDINFWTEENELLCVCCENIKEPGNDEDTCTGCAQKIQKLPNKSIRHH